MKFIPLDNDRIPAIGLGTYKINGPGASDIIKKAIGLGYRHIDTAQLYENEQAIGIAIRSSGIPRDEIFLTTKVWPSNLSEDRFLPSVKETLQKLNVEYVDMLLVHWPHHQMAPEEYIPVLMDIQQQGLTKNIGVSNFNITQLKACLKTGAKIITNQVEFHPWINQTKLHNWMHGHRIALTAYCPLGKGRFMNDKKLDVIAAKYLRTPAQIILRWMMQKDNVIAIPKSTNLFRLEENISVFDFELRQEDMDAIDAWRLENIRLVGVQAGAKWDS